MIELQFGSWRAMVVRAVAVAGLVLLSGAAMATEQSKDRQEGRAANQDAKQKARTEKVDCRKENEKSNAACRQDKRETKQDGRKEKRDIKY